MTAEYCCGNRNEQYCCTLQEKILEDPSYKNKARQTYDNNYSSDSKDNITFIIILAIAVPVLFLACIGLSVCIFCTQKERIYAMLPQKE